MLEPKGLAADEIAWLSWVFFVLGTLIWIGVMVYLGLALFRRRRQAGEHPGVAGSQTIVVGGAVFTAIVLVVLFGLSMTVMRTFTQADASLDDSGLVIEVVGNQWWWEVRYPEQDFVTANEVHIPVGQPVRILLASDDVIHSFWVPELAGKMDLIPGRVNSFWLQADEPGQYLGECAEFCGTQHAKMQFIVVAETDAAFSAWIERQQQPASSPAEGSLEAEGQQVFLSEACANCHTIEGTSAAGQVGPNLTHLASRLTIGAGILQNNRGHLGGWVVDPQAIKPGVFMPPTVLESSELQALLAYLATLE